MIYIQLLPHCLSFRVEGLQVLNEWRVGFEGSVIAPDPDGALLDLELAASFYVVEDSSEELTPVCYASGDCELVK
ncbi:hypothetical protein N7447_002345 [Penicillium robsamsonii]|uniref:uncharacterized protein n=1 Tax=Penicillium robsamsonii TaxID=1792511 RepID=UPI00254872A1|nr:uncharacterized protein N7447_002345 [Penicillium robsamsonii]KAJ5836319.1 hypothetical protein N7447_002345 [Penicillium robsamsonii]